MYFGSLPYLIFFLLSTIGLSVYLKKNITHDCRINNYHGLYASKAIMFTINVAVRDDDVDASKLTFSQQTCKLEMCTGQPHELEKMLDLNDGWQSANMVTVIPVRSMGFT